MVRFTKTSSTGKRARAPRWWGQFAESLPKFDLPWLGPKSWTPALARKWVEAIPSKCPFERQIWCGERLLVYVPPLCPLNPFSSQLYRIRLEAQTYLAGLQTSDGQFKD